MKPYFSKLQAAIIDILEGKESISGRDLRNLLIDRGHNLSGPRFYQEMANLEDDKVVRGWYETFFLEGNQLRERQYCLLNEE